MLVLYITSKVLGLQLVGKIGRSTLLPSFLELEVFSGVFLKSNALFTKHCEEQNFVWYTYFSHIMSSAPSLHYASSPGSKRRLFPTPLHSLYPYLEYSSFFSPFPPPKTCPRTTSFGHLSLLQDYI